jgi:hypothetical protein
MGYSCVTTVLSAAANTNLTDLATVKDELDDEAQDTSNDAWLTRAITRVSDAVQVYCKRTFAPQFIQDVFDVDQDPYPYQTPGGFAGLQLSAWPIIAIVSVVQTLAVGLTQTLVEGTDFRTNAKTGELLRLNPFTGVVTTWEALPVTVVYTAGQGALVTETDTVPASAPYQVSVAQAATYSCTQSVAYASGVALTAVAANPAQGQFSVTAGVYAFNAADKGLPLTFTYAVTNIDSGLVDICLQLITARYAAKGRDPNLIQQDTPGVGVQRWWFGGAPGQKGQFPPDLEAALDTGYRVPTVA